MKTRKTVARKKPGKGAPVEPVKGSQAVGARKSRVKAQGSSSRGAKGKQASKRTGKTTPKHAANSKTGPLSKDRAPDKSSASMRVGSADANLDQSDLAASGLPGGDDFDVAALRVDRDMLLTALPHPIFVLDRDRQFVYVSGAAETFFETSAAMLTRMGFDDVVNFSSPLCLLVNQVLDTGCTVNEYAVEISTKRFENSKLVDVYAGPIPERSDLTIVMLLQRTMAQMIERQLTHRAAARSVSGMASVLAHEIKNPLSGIRGAAQLLEQNLSDEDRVLSRLICAETDRINKLVDRMEVFGDERPINKDPINIHDVLSHVRTLALAGFAEGVLIVEDYDPSLPPVPGDRDQLIQAFLNLIKNATEALRGDRLSDRITIRTAFRPGVRLSVPGATTRISLPLMIVIEDNGSGVDDYLKPHLFDPFVTTKTGGTGLGLALVAKIIGDHGGVIECESESGGTLFRVLLPLQPLKGTGEGVSVSGEYANGLVGD